MQALLLLLLILSCIQCGNSFVDLRTAGKRVKYLLSQNAAVDGLPSVAVVGSGAVGCYYGARLWEGGNYNVKFHMRGLHYKASVEKGLNVTSVYGNMFIPPEYLAAFETTEQIGKVDWVIVALKSSSLDDIPELILPLLDEETTRVVFIMNGLIENDILTKLKEVSGGKEPIECAAGFYGGMALICCNRIEPGWVDHSYAGLLSGGCAVSRSSDPATDQEAFEDLWKNTKVEIAYEPSLLKGRWKKNVWNLPFNGISVSMGGITVDKIVSDPGLRSLAYTVMDETIAVANADLAFNGEDSSTFLGETEKKAMMYLSDGMGDYSTSTMLDLVERRPMEVKYMFRKAVDRANELNVPVPHLETIVTLIEEYQHYNL